MIRARSNIPRASPLKKAGITCSKNISPKPSLASLGSTIEGANQDLISNQLAEPIFDIQKVKLDLNQIIDQNNISSYVFYVNNLIQQVNAAVNDQKIWNIGKPEDSRTRPDLLKLLRGYQESLVIIAILWFPIQPDISQKIFSCFYDQQEPIPNLETMTWNQLKPNTKINKFNGVLFKKYQPKALIAVDLYGQSADYNEILELCEVHDVAVIEDAAEAFMSKHKKKYLGTFGILGCFSFSANTITVLEAHAKDLITWQIPIDPKTGSAAINKTTLQLARRA